ncbi:hypothetical protein [Aliikangiella sp. IMCC44359]|uniref:hypothetical protein n=1 Tax=Aliikangiella sp. IMCC44359 TaxID=3459125 RepID=UPI00403A98D6
MLENNTEINKYYLLTTGGEDQMLLYGMPDLPNDLKDDWMFGQIFTEEPEQPIHVEITEGFERKKLLPFFKTPPVASQAFVDALIEIGVDNIITYDVLLHNEDYSVTYEGFKAINIIGLVKAAGPGTVYLSDSRLIDASIDTLELEPRSIKGLYIFRLAESISTIVLHEKVKRHLESKGFEDLNFIEPGDALIL